MNNYKEIVTKAIIGKSKKTSTDKFNVKIENKVDTVLGCWVINHKFNGVSNNNEINVNGSYDINIWYSYDNDTKTSVAKETLSYSDNLSVNVKDKISDGKEVIVRSLKNPSVKEVNITSDGVDLVLEKELAVDVLGNTTIKVPVETIDDDYEDITVNSNEEIDNIEINDEYIK